MILRDGTRSDNPFTYFDEDDEDEDGEVVFNRYDYFLPQNKRITKVTIYYKEVIAGFRFHLSDGSNWDIGDFAAPYTVTVNISDNEVIVGFKAKSHPISPAKYVEWQFITAQGLRFN